MAASAGKAQNCVMRKKRYDDDELRDDELEYIESEPAGELPPLSAQHLSYTHTVSHIHCTLTQSHIRTLQHIHIHWNAITHTHCSTAALHWYLILTVRTAMQSYTHTALE